MDQGDNFLSTALDVLRKSPPLLLMLAVGGEQSQVARSIGMARMVAAGESTLPAPLQAEQESPVKYYGDEYLSRTSLQAGLSDDLLPANAVFI